MPARAAENKAPRLFISYSHDSREHEDRIRVLADRLRQDGIDAVIDQYDTAPPDGWPIWMDCEIRRADFIALACTETYLNRVEGRETPGKGRGVLWEAKLIFSYLYEGTGAVQRFIPILLDGQTATSVPRPLRDLTRYDVDTAEGYELFYRHLTGQPRVERPNLGTVRALPPIAAQSYPASLAFSTHSVPAVHVRRYRLQLLNRVRSDWIDGFLNQSLYQVARIELGLHGNPGAVEQPLRTIVQGPDRPPEALAPGTSITKIFDERSSALLILGEPGTGKTTLLLELARDLLARAENDDTYPIAVVFNLSSWAARRRKLSDWLVDELNERSDVSKRLAQQWIDGEQIIPLLDGLDEVDAEHRKECTEAINVFRREHGLLPVAVCSRIADYEQLGMKLRLRSAVIVQLLARGEIEGYLSQIGQPAFALLTALERGDPTVWEVLQTPLMLWVCMLTYRDVPQEIPSAESVEHLRAMFLDEFVVAMFKRRSAKTRFSAERTVSILCDLARFLKKTNQSIFYLEDLSSDWLVKRSDRWLWRLGTGVVIAVCGGLISGLLAGWQLQVQHRHLRWDGVSFGLGIGLIVCVISMWMGYFVTPRPVETIHIRRVNLLQRAKSGRVRGWRSGWKLGFWIGIVYAAIYCFVEKDRIELLNSTYPWPVKLASIALVMGLMGIIMGIFLGVILALIGGLISGTAALLPAEAVQTRKKPNQGLHRSIMTAWAAAIFFGLLIGRVTWLTAGSVPGLRVGILSGLLAALAFGGLFSVNHIMLRVMLQLRRSLPLDVTGFLDFAVERLFLRRVGAGYLFTHKLFWQHFLSLADLRGPVKSPERVRRPRWGFRKIPALAAGLRLVTAIQSSSATAKLRELRSKWRAHRRRALWMASALVLAILVWSAVRAPSWMPLSVGTAYDAAENYGAARQWYETAAGWGSGQAMNRLGLMYKNGHGVRRDYHKTREWFEKGYAAGNVYAGDNLGHLYEEGNGVAQDYSRAREFYLKGAPRGSDYAMYHLGYLYDRGYGVARDYQKAEQWYEKAARLGNKLAMKNLGTLYDQGRGVLQDHQKAKRWYAEAAGANTK